MITVQYNKKTNTTTIKETAIPTGRKVYRFLMRGYVAQEYDTSPFAVVELSPERAAAILRQLDALHKVPNSFRMIRCSFHGSDAHWLSSVKGNDAINAVDETSEAVLLTEQQAKELCSIENFRDFGQSVEYTVDQNPENEGVQFCTEEKHVHIEIYTFTLYRADLERMAGKLYRRPA